MLLLRRWLMLLLRRWLRLLLRRLAGLLSFACALTVLAGTLGDMPRRDCERITTRAAELSADEL
jgi:hypothetical protein